MTPEFSDTLDADLARIVREVYQTMTGCTVEPAAASVLQTPPDAVLQAAPDAVLQTPLDAVLQAAAPLTAAVYYAGAWKGALVIECSGRQASRWAEGFMPLTGPATSEDARDGLAEIANVIAGNLKPFLPPGVSLSMPSVIEGTDHKLRLPESCHRDTVPFADEMDPFRISLAVFP